MAESISPPNLFTFDHHPNIRSPQVIESYCPICGMFIGSSMPDLLETAELSHICPLEFLSVKM